MKIAVYSGNIPSTTFIENLISGLSQSGFEIYLFGKKTKDVVYNEKVRQFPTPSSNFNLVLFDIRESLKLFFKNPKLLFKTVSKFSAKRKGLKNFLKDLGFLLPVLNNQPDVFHIQWAKTVRAYPEIFEILNCRIALSLRGAHINYSPIADKSLADAYRKYFPLVDGFHAVSSAIANEATKYNADAGKIKVIYSSVNDDLLKKESVKYEGSEPIKIISIGRFHWKKGYHYALDAMKILKEANEKFSYTIIAQDNVPEEILFILEDYKLHNEVKIISGIPYDELIKKLQESHLLLLPSVEEGIANVVLEAMAAGVTVLTTDCGGMNEVVTDGQNGFIVQVRSPQAIADKVKEFKNSNNNLRMRMIDSAKDTIVTNFSRQKQVNEFTNFYNSLSN